jgi:cytochrome b561
MAEQAIATGAGYSLTARIFHWITAVIVLGMVVVGFVIANEWGGPMQDALYDTHKSTGALLIPIVLARILYRFKNPAPPLPADIPAVQQLAAYATHYLLYSAIVAQMFIGYIGTSAYPAPVPFYGLFNLPPIWPANRALSEQLFVVHRFLGVTIAVLALMHIGAALYHHFVRRDRVLMRMISG